MRSSPEMREAINQIDRDPVLSAFVDACLYPELDDVVAWTNRHSAPPQLGHADIKPP